MWNISAAHAPLTLPVTENHNQGKEGWTALSNDFIKKQFISTLYAQRKAGSSSAYML